MDTIRRMLLAQYEKSLAMLSETIGLYDDGLWLDHTSYDSPAWQVAYHALYYTNIYCSPTEEEVSRWSKERQDLHRFARPGAQRSERTAPGAAYTKEDTLDYLSFVRATIPSYLERMEPEARCWPSWYDEPQLEFHLNNLRHLQHHVGQLIERRDIVDSISYEWY